MVVRNSPKIRRQSLETPENPNDSWRSPWRFAVAPIKRLEKRVARQLNLMESHC